MVQSRQSNPSQLVQQECEESMLTSNRNNSVNHTNMSAKASAMS